MPNFDYSEFVRQAALLGQGNSEFMGYFNKYPDLQTEWRRISSDGTAARRGWSTPEQYAQWHWQTYGQAEGRTFDSSSAPAILTPPPSSTLGDAVRDDGTRIPQRSDTEIQETARLARMREQRRGGRGSTILTGSSGVTSPFQAGRPQLRQAGLMG